MGMMQAIELANNTGISIQDQLSIHFRNNCYPSIPQQMIPTAVEAIYAYNDEELDKLIPLPEGVSFRGETEVSARDVISSYYLGAWCSEDS